jgi:hypothetical protein
MKKLTYELIPTNTTVGLLIYGMAEELIADHHDDLKEARIAIAWNRSWKPDVDGRQTLGKMKKASDLDRELMHYDFVVILSESFWTHPDVTDHQRRALMDHELSHGARKLHPETLEPIEDAKGRTVYRIIKHDIEEFSSVVRRWGCWKHELEVFFGSLQKGRARHRGVFLRRAAEGMLEARAGGILREPAEGSRESTAATGRGRIQRARCCGTHEAEVRKRRE